MTLSKQTSPLIFCLPMPFPPKSLWLNVWFSSPKRNIKRFHIHSQGEKEHLRRRAIGCVCVRVCVCVCVWVISEHMCPRRLLYDHTPTGACECPLADRHTHVARWECWERLMRMPFYRLICRNIQHVITLKTCFSEWARQTALNKCLICDWGHVICPTLAGRRAIWVGEWERHTGEADGALRASGRLTAVSSTPSPKAPFLLCSLSALFTLGCEDRLIMAGLSAPAPF